MKAYGYIYLVRNRVNGKVYVGQTIYPVLHRWKRHLRFAHNTKHNTHFACAIRAHGDNAFDVVEIGSAHSKEELDAMEIRHIALNDATNPDVGYNGSLGGNAGGAWTEERRAHMSAKLKGRTYSPESLANMREGFKKFTGKKHSLDTVKKRAETHRGAKRSPEAVKRIRDAQRRPEVIEKQRATARRRKEALLAAITEKEQR